MPAVTNISGGGGSPNHVADSSSSLSANSSISVNMGSPPGGGASMSSVSSSFMTGSSSRSSSASNGGGGQSSASNNDCGFKIGTTVKCILHARKPNSPDQRRIENEGEVLAYDPRHKVLVLKSPSANGRQSQSNVHILNLNLPYEVVVVSEERKDNVVNPPSLNMQKLENRLREQVERKKRLVMAFKSGDPAGQSLFQAICKTIDDVAWSGENITVLKEVTIYPPYKPENVKGREDSKALSHVRKIVEKHVHDQEESTAKVAAGGEDAANAHGNASRVASSANTPGGSPSNPSPQSSSQSSESLPSNCGGGPSAECSSESSGKPTAAAAVSPPAAAPTATSAGNVKPASSSSVENVSGGKSSQGHRNTSAAPGTAGGQQHTGSGGLSSSSSSSSTYGSGSSGQASRGGHHHSSRASRDSKDQQYFSARSSYNR